MSEAADDLPTPLQRLYRCGVCGFMSEDVDLLRDHMLASHLDDQTVYLEKETTDESVSIYENPANAFDFDGQMAECSGDDQLPVGEASMSEAVEDHEVDLQFKVKMPKPEMALFPRHIKPALFFTCSYCDHKHQSFKEVALHIASYHPKKLDQRLRARTEANTHDVSVINNTAYLTKKTVRKAKSLLYDSSKLDKDDKQSRAFSCALCHMKCSSQLVLDIHKRCHVGNTRKLQCCFCGKQAPTAKAWYGLYIHMVNRHSEHVPAPHSCSVCKKGFVKAFDLRKHMTCHSMERPYPCDSCMYSFKNKKNLRDHQILKHRMGTEAEREALLHRLRSRPRPELDDNLPWLTCSSCSYKTKVKFKLNIHAKSHTGVRDIKCDYCEYRTYDKSALRRHEWRHRAVKPFTCACCDFSCIQRAQIYAHYKNKHSMQPDEVAKLVQHVNGPRVYTHTDLVDLEPDPAVALQQIVVDDPSTISLDVEGETTTVDVDLLTQAAQGLVATNQELHAS